MTVGCVYNLVHLKFSPSLIVGRPSHSKPPLKWKSIGGSFHLLFKTYLAFYIDMLLMLYYICHSQFIFKNFENSLIQHVDFCDCIAATFIIYVYFLMNSKGVS